MPLRFYQRVLWLFCTIATILLLFEDFLVFPRHCARTAFMDRSAFCNDSSPAVYSQLMINPGSVICGNSSMLLFIYIHSAADHLEKRYLVRHTWGSPHFISKYLQMEIKLIFMLGSVANESLQAAIEIESNLYGDIVQGCFFDHYRNLTWKAIMAMHWTTQYCSHAKYVLKADDDVLIHIYGVVKFIKKLDATSSTMWCNTWGMGTVHREKDDKWYVTEEEYPKSHYPTYCPGLAILISGDLIPKLYEATQFTRFFWIDDIYMTGFLPLNVSVNFVSTYYAYVMMVITEVNVDGFVPGSSLLFYHHMKTVDWYKLWYAIASETIQLALKDKQDKVNED